MRRRRVLRVAAAGTLVLATVGGAVLVPSARPQAAAGPVVSQPVLGSADEATVLLGSVTDGGLPGETWAYRVLPSTAAPPAAAGDEATFGAPGAGIRPDPQLAFLRATDDSSWSVVQTPLGRDGRPSRGITPNVRAARVLPRGGGFVLGRALGTLTAGDETHVLVRDPGGRFRDVPAPGPDVLLAGGDPQPDDPAEVLAGDQGLGAATVAGWEDGERTNVVVAPRGRPVQDAILRFDGTTWSREPVDVPAASDAEFEIIALDATGPENAWFVARTDEDPARGIVLFERRVTRDGPRWQERPLVGTPFAQAADPDRGLSAIAPLGGGLQQTLTVDTDGVWVDGSLRAGDTELDWTVRFDPEADGGAGAVTGSWCDARDDGGEAVCEHPLGLRFSRRTGYRSLAFATDGVPGRVITNPLRPGGDEDSNLGTYVVLDGSTFRRRPGAAGNLRRSAAFRSPEDGWLEGPVRVSRAPRGSALRPWPVAVRSPFTAVVHQPGAPPGDLGTQALAVGASGAVARHVPGSGWVREFLLTSSGAVTSPTLRGVAWPEAGRAYAVGDLGAMWLWRAETGLWERDPAAPVGFEANLMGVAFQPGSTFRGYAVGRGGTLLRYDKTWTQEPVPADVATRDLTAVTFAGAQALVAAGGDLLVSDGGPWRVDEQVRALLATLPGAEVKLLTVAGLPDGGAVAAGREVVLVRDRAGAPWRFADQPLPGLTAVAAAAVRDGEVVRPVLSVVPRLAYPPSETLPEPDANVPAPILPPIPLPGDGYVLRETANGWSDEQRQAFAGASADRPSKPDPVAAFDLSPTGEGWAVGGWSGEFDSAGRGSSGRNATGRLNRQRVQTAAILRYGTSAANAPPAAGISEVPLDPNTVTFAVAGHAQCERECADLAGQDLAPDRMLATTIARVGALARRPNGPRALLYTGGRTRPGTGMSQRPAEAARYAALLAGTGELPVFPAVSAGDAETGTTAAFRDAFAGFGAPFGTGAPRPRCRPARRRRTERGRDPLRLRVRRADRPGAGHRHRQQRRVARRQRPAPEPAGASASVADRAAGRGAGRRGRERRGRVARPEHAHDAGAERRLGR
ncbi:hypothetical protein [Conexibacter sp. W3-3-2]|uniref:hypothetical protein n=1 Tax=Conexibacter sp. W3-3-2 TaxID=2675227 RepID=UPI001E28DF38|nr:hypothetical protein [Conexibacter sp. W3-3-2]